MDQEPQSTPYYSPAINQQQQHPQHQHQHPHQHQHHQQQQQPQQPEPNDKKRKGDGDDTPPLSRSKRNRYISIACNECKRRKIKCNGQNPCQRCGNLSLECIYAPNCCSSTFKDSEEFRTMNAHIQSLQQQVNDLYAHLNALRNGQSPFPMHPSLAQADSPAAFRSTMSPTQSRGSHPQFQGPTSSAFNLDVAKSSLQTMGITDPEISGESGASEIDPALNAPPQHQAPMAAMVTPPSKDPLWQLSKDDAIRLCKIYDEEMGIMYPMLDTQKTLHQVDKLFTFVEAARRTGLVDMTKAGADSLEGNDVNVLKMVLATALIVEGYGESMLGRALYDSCREAFESRLSGPVEIKGLILLVIVAEYHFQQDDEVQAYRIIGLATRLCLEMGLHRRETLYKNFSNDQERTWAVKLFWSIYVLDRRWSFGTGMPFALQDADIDPSLPEPDDSTPYMTAMISYSRISAKVWQSMTGSDSATNKIDKDNIGFLDYQILQWHNSIPDSLKYDKAAGFSDSRPISRGQRRLQVILSLRTNQMRILIYRPVLHSLTTIMENRRYAQTGVDVARDTMRVLSHLNEATDIYRTAQVCFNYFLLSAMAVFFLAVAHAPNEFSHQIRDEFYQALDLVKGLSNRSYVSRRLWKAIKGWKAVGPKLGMVSRQTHLTNANDPHSNAAVAMAGLAGHQVDEMAAYASAQNSSSISSSPMNGQQISHELTNLFEAAGGYGNAPQTHPQGLEELNGYVASQGDLPQEAEGMSGLYGNHDGEFSKIMGDLF